MGLTIEKCIEGWINSLRQMNAKADIVFFGDSLTYYGDFASIFPDKVVCNLGLRGDTIQGMINRIEQVRILHPDKVYIMAGINDVANSSLEEFSMQYKKLIELLKKNLPESLIIVQGLLPVNDVDFKVSCNNMQVSRSNEVIELLCSEYGLQFKNLYNQYVNNGILPKVMTVDGIHLSPFAYNMWYDLLKTEICNDIGIVL